MAEKKKTSAAPKKKCSRKLVPAKKKVSTAPKVALRIVQKPISATVKRSKPEQLAPIDAAKAADFGMSIAEAMKRKTRQAEEAKATAKDADGIRLTRRPTTRARGEATACFPKTDLDEFRKRLIAARVKALDGVDAMRATGFNESEDREADGGDGTNQTLRLQALGQMGNINRTILQIDEALHRIDDGSYGVCTSCGQLIRKQRLLNQPFVLTCMECQNSLEQENRK